MAQQQNPIYKFMLDNKLTQLDEQAFMSKYSQGDEYTKLYEFMKNNNLTELSPEDFQSKYMQPTQAQPQQQQQAQQQQAQPAQGQPAQGQQNQPQQQQQVREQAPQQGQQEQIEQPQETQQKRPRLNPAPNDVITADHTQVELNVGGNKVAFSIDSDGDIALTKPYDVIKGDGAYPEREESADSLWRAGDSPEFDKYEQYVNVIGKTPKQIEQELNARWQEMGGKPKLNLLQKSAMGWRTLFSGKKKEDKNLPVTNDGGDIDERQALEDNAGESIDESLSVQGYKPISDQVDISQYDYDKPEFVGLNKQIIDTYGKEAVFGRKREKYYPIEDEAEKRNFRLGDQISQALEDESVATRNKGLYGYLGLKDHGAMEWLPKTDRKAYFYERDLYKINETLNKLVEEDPTNPMIPMLRQEQQQVSSKYYEQIAIRNKYLDREIASIQEALRTGVYVREHADAGEAVQHFMANRETEMTPELRDRLEKRLSDLQARKGLVFSNTAEETKATIDDALEENADGIMTLFEKGLIPEDATPHQALQAYYLYTYDAWKKGYIDEKRKTKLGNALETVGEALGAGRSDREQEYDELGNTLQALAPLAFLNRSNLNEGETALQVFAKRALAGVGTTRVKQFKFGTTQSDITQKTQQAIQEIGIEGSVKNWYDQQIEEVNAEYGNWTGKGLAETAGVSMQYIAPTIATSFAFGAALRSTAVGRDFFRLANSTSRLATAETALGRYIVANPKAAGWLGKAASIAKQGAEWGIIEQVNQQVDDELFLASGLMSGLGGETVEGFTTWAIGAFGKRAPVAVRLMSEYLGKIGSEMLQETFEEVAGTVKQEDLRYADLISDVFSNGESWQQFKGAWKEKFPEADDTAWFLASVAVMGAMMNGTSMMKLMDAKYRQEYADATEEQRQAAQQIVAANQKAAEGAVTHVVNTLKAEGEGEGTAEGGGKLQQAKQKVKQAAQKAKPVMTAEQESVIENMTGDDLLQSEQGKALADPVKGHYVGSERGRAEATQRAKGYARQAFAYLNGDMDAKEYLKRSAPKIDQAKLSDQEIEQEADRHAQFYWDKLKAKGVDIAAIKERGKTIAEERAKAQQQSPGAAQEVTTTNKRIVQENTGATIGQYMNANKDNLPAGDAYVNGKTVEPGYVLQAGDVITFGSPDVQEGVEGVAEPTAEPTAATAAEPATEPTAAEPATEPAAEPAAEPTATIDEGTEVTRGKKKYAKIGGKWHMIPEDGGAPVRASAGLSKQLGRSLAKQTREANAAAKTAAEPTVEPTVEPTAEPAKGKSVTTPEDVAYDEGTEVNIGATKYAKIDGKWHLIPGKGSRVMPSSVGGDLPAKLDAELEKKTKAAAANKNAANPIQDRDIDPDFDGLEKKYSNSRRAAGKRKAEIVASIRKATAALRSIASNAQVVIAETDEEYMAMLEKVLSPERLAQIKKQGGSRSEYLIDPDTKKVAGIIINLSQAKRNTAGHEVVHAALAEAIGADPNIMADMVDRILNKAEALTTKTTGELAKFVAKYQGQGTAVQIEEFLTELSGMMQTGDAKLYKKLSDEIKRAINDIVKAITNGKVDAVFSDYAKTADVIDFMQELSDRIREGKDISGTVEKFKKAGEKIKAGQEKAAAKEAAKAAKAKPSRVKTTKAPKRVAKPTPAPAAVKKAAANPPPGKENVTKLKKLQEFKYQGYTFVFSHVIKETKGMVEVGAILNDPSQPAHGVLHKLMIRKTTNLVVGRMHAKLPSTKQAKPQGSTSTKADATSKKAKQDAAKEKAKALSIDGILKVATDAKALSERMIDMIRTNYRPGVMQPEKLGELMLTMVDKAKGKIPDADHQSVVKAVNDWVQQAQKTYDSKSQAYDEYDEEYDNMSDEEYEFRRQEEYLLIMMEWGSSQEALDEQKKKVEAARIAKDVVNNKEVKTVEDAHAYAEKNGMKLILAPGTSMGMVQYKNFSMMCDWTEVEETVEEVRRDYEQWQKMQYGSRSQAISSLFDGKEATSAQEGTDVAQLARDWMEEQGILPEQKRFKVKPGKRVPPYLARVDLRQFALYFKRLNNKVDPIKTKEELKELYPKVHPRRYHYRTKEHAQRIVDMHAPYLDHLLEAASEVNKGKATLANKKIASEMQPKKIKVSGKFDSKSQANDFTDADGNLDVGSLNYEVHELIGASMGIKPSDLMYMNGGGFGHAYRVVGGVHEGKVLKYTQDKTEAAIANTLIGKSHGRFVKIYDVTKIVEPDTGKELYYILMEGVDATAQAGRKIRSLFYALSNIATAQGHTAPLDRGYMWKHIDWDNIEDEMVGGVAAITDEFGGWDAMITFMKEVQEIHADYAKIGMTGEGRYPGGDTHEGNLGYRADGTLAAFDISSWNGAFTEFPNMGKYGEPVETTAKHLQKTVELLAQIDAENQDFYTSKYYRETGGRLTAIENRYEREKRDNRKLSIETARASIKKMIEDSFKYEDYRAAADAERWSKKDIDRAQRALENALNMNEEDAVMKYLTDRGRYSPAEADFIMNEMMSPEEFQEVASRVKEQVAAAMRIQLEETINKVEQLRAEKAKWRAEFTMDKEMQAKEANAEARREAMRKEKDARMKAWKEKNAANPASNTVSQKKFDSKSQAIGKIVWDMDVESWTDVDELTVEVEIQDTKLTLAGIPTGRNKMLSDWFNIFPESREYKQNETIVVETLHTPEEFRGQGSASAAMNELIRAADANEVNLYLIASPFDQATKKTLGHQQLVNFYKGFGFVELAGAASDVTEMFRPPYGHKVNRTNAMKKAAGKMRSASEAHWEKSAEAEKAQRKFESKSQAIWNRNRRSTPPDVQQRAQQMVNDAYKQYYEHQQDRAHASLNLYETVKEYAKEYRKANKGSFSQFWEELQNTVSFTGLSGTQTSRLVKDAWDGHTKIMEDFGGVTEAGVALENDLTGWDQFREVVEDRDISIKNLQALVKKQRGELPDDWDAYTARQLERSRAAFRIKQVEEYLFGKGKMEWGYSKSQNKSFVGRLKKAGLTWHQFGDYLYAKHAEERNQRMRDLAADPTLVRPSGMTKDEAQKVIDDFTPEQRAALEEFASEFRENIIKPAIQILYDNGILNEEKYNALINGTSSASSVVFDNYVPLRYKEEFLRKDGDFDGDKVEATAIHSLSVQGGKESIWKQRENPAETAFAMFVTNIEEVERNETKKRVAALIENNPQARVGVIVKPRIVVDIDEGTGQIKEIKDWTHVKIGDRTYTSSFIKQNSISYKVDGKMRYIFIGNRSIREALQNPRTPQYGKRLKQLLSVTNMYMNFMRMVLTGGNIDFMFPNAIRDIQDAMFNLSSVRADEKNRSGAVGDEKGKMRLLRAQVMANLPRAWAAVLRFEAGAEKGKYTELMYEAAAHGMQMSWMKYGNVKEALEIIKEHRDNVNKKATLRDGGLGTVRYLGEFPFRTLGRVVLTMNTAAEQSTRLAVYAALKERFLDAGMDNEAAATRAAGIAKNITINFEKQGTATPIINSMWLFMNAGVQGVARGAKTLTTKEGLAYFGGIAAFSFFKEMFNHMMEEEDDDDMFLYNNWVRDNNMLINIPGSKDPIKVPKPYSILRLAMNVGEYAYLAGFSKEMTWSEAIFKTMGTLRTVSDPIGGSGTTGIFPTIIKPAMELGINRDWKGDKIIPNYYLDAPAIMPHQYVNYKNPEWLKKTAEFLYDNDVSNELNIHPSFSPIAMQYLFNSYLGTGMIKRTQTSMRELGKVLDNRNMAELFGERSGSMEVNRNNIMIINRFYGDVDHQLYLYKAYLQKLAEDMNKKTFTRELTEVEKQHAREAYKKLLREDKKGILLTETFDRYLGEAFYERGVKGVGK